MTRQSSADDELRPLVRDAIADLIGELGDSPPQPVDLAQSAGISRLASRAPRSFALAASVTFAAVLAAVVFAVWVFGPDGQIEVVAPEVPVRTDPAQEPSVVVPHTDVDPPITDPTPRADRLEWVLAAPPSSAGTEWVRTAPGSRTIRVGFTHHSRVAVPGNPCAPELFTAVTETDDEVRVAVTAVVEFTADMPADRYDWFIADDGTVRPDCPAVGEQRVLDVDLAEPLGARRLVFAGQDFEVFTAQLATPRWVPEDWQLVLDHIVFREQSDVLTPGWNRTWESQPDSRGQFRCEPRTQTGLALLEGPAEVVEYFIREPWEPGTVNIYDINGVLAEYAIDTDRNRTRLTWTVEDYSYVLQSLEFATQCPLGEPPDVETILRFARELAIE